MFNKWKLIAQAVMVLDLLSSVSRVEARVEKTVGFRPSYLAPHPVVQEVCRTSQLADQVQQQVIKSGNDLWQWELQSADKKHEEVYFLDDLTDYAKVEHVSNRTLPAYCPQKETFTVNDLSKWDGYPAYQRQEQICDERMEYQKINFTEVEDDFVKVDYYFNEGEYQAEKAKEKENKTNLKALSFYPEEDIY